jgi:broad specificity phosphatase PhoE
VLELIYEAVGDPAEGWLPGAADLDAAVALGRRHADVDAVFSSDLGRALETVAVAFGTSDVPVFYDWRLREWDCGALAGAPTEELDPEQHLEVPYPGGESYADVLARVASFVRDVETYHAGKRVLLVTHAGPIGALRQLRAPRP